MKPYYQDDAVTIYHGDCREILPTFGGGSFAMAFADPPYGVGLDYDEHDDAGGESYAAWMAELHAELIRVAPLVLVTPGVRNLTLWPKATWVLAWSKPGATGRSDLGGFNEWEPVLMYGKKRIYNDWRLASVGAEKSTGDHPCPKPLSLLSWLVEQTTQPGDTIIDPFLGSGTTARAGKDAGRKVVGIEKSERYCEIAAKRMGQEVLDFGAA